MRQLDEPQYPSWFWILLGAALVGVLPSAPPAEFSDSELAARVPYSEKDSREASELPVRELRMVPGIGQTRALAIARERWRAEREGREFVLLDVPGIGPSIAGQLALWNARRSP